MDWEALQRDVVFETLPMEQALRFLRGGWIVMARWRILGEASTWVGYLDKGTGHPFADHKKAIDVARALTEIPDVVESVTVRLGPEDRYAGQGAREA